MPGHFGYGGRQQVQFLSFFLVRSRSYVSFALPTVPTDSSKESAAKSHNVTDDAIAVVGGRCDRSG
jgi:hypothetical protein